MIYWACRTASSCRVLSNFSLVPAFYLILTWMQNIQANSGFLKIFHRNSPCSTQGYLKGFYKSFQIRLVCMFDWQTYINMQKVFFTAVEHWARLPHYKVIFVSECHCHFSVRHEATHQDIWLLSRAVASGGGAVVPEPPFHVWPLGCCIHPILFF